MKRRSGSYFDDFDGSDSESSESKRPALDKADADEKMDVSQEEERGKRLRSGFIKERPLLAKARPFVRNTKEYIYPSSYGERSINPRKGMPKDITSALERNANRGRIDSIFAQRAIPLGSLRLGEDDRFQGNLRMKDNNISRNHILADSRIRNILTKTYEKVKGGGIAPEEGRVILEFFQSLAGDEKGSTLYARFQDACLTKNRDRFNDIMHETCNGLVNLRLGDATLNEDISNQFDPVIIDGRYSRETIRIHDAVRMMAHKGFIDHADAFDALATAKKRSTLSDTSSTVFSRRVDGFISNTQGRANIFDRPLDMQSFERNHTFSGVGNPRPEVRQPSLDWHG